MTDRICSVADCEKVAEKRGWCSMHYSRWRKHGALTLPDVDERMWREMVDKNSPDGCWLWLGNKERRGYGKLKRNRRTVMAHRYIYTLLVGPIPDGHELDHLCKVTSCVNPAHLEPVLPDENRRRSDSPMMVFSRATHCVNGHEFTEDNTYRPPGKANYRGCRTCRRNSNRKATAAKGACAKGHPYPPEPPRDAEGKRYCAQCRAASLAKAIAARWAE